MFLTLPTSAPCSSRTPPTPSTQDTLPKSRRHTTLLTLLKPKKEKRKSKPYTHPIDTKTPSSPTTYNSLYQYPSSTSKPEDQPTSPSLHIPTRSRTKKQSHIRKPSKPWTQAPNAPKRAPTFPSSEEEKFDSYTLFHPTPSASRNSHMLKVSTSSFSPTAESPVQTYPTYYPTPSSQMPDLTAFSPFGSAPSSSDFYSHATEIEKRGRRISTGCAWEKIGERRAREGARNW